MKTEELFRKWVKLETIIMDPFTVSDPALDLALLLDIPGECVALWESQTGTYDPQQDFFSDSVKKKSNHLIAT